MLRTQHFLPPYHSRSGFRSSCRSARTGLSSSRRHVGRGRRSADKRRAGQMPSCFRPEAGEKADTDLPAAGRVTNETEGRKGFGDARSDALARTESIPVTFAYAHTPARVPERSKTRSTCAVIPTPQPCSARSVPISERRPLRQRRHLSLRRSGRFDEGSCRPAGARQRRSTSRFPPGPPRSSQS